jgi:5-methylcytosine-specific restriction endonuclease McrA
MRIRQPDLFSIGKVCRDCRRDLPLSEYYDQPSNLDGKKTRCKSCYRAVYRRIYTKKPKKTVFCSECEGPFRSKFGEKVCSPKCKRLRKQRLRKKNIIMFICRNPDCRKLSWTTHSNRANYCDHDCYVDHRDYTKHSVYICSCVTCGKNFKSKSTNAIYCCDDHKYRFCSVYSGRCETCQAAFTSKRERKYCSDYCYPGYKPLGVRVFKCDDCGFDFKAEYKNPYCTDCRDKRRRKYERKRKKLYGNHRRRARTFEVDYKPVNSLRVFRRDGFVCQICGVKTKLKLRGTNHDREPTIDHIIPMSKGGPNTYDNVQTACRSCNTAKGNRLLGQAVLLFDSPM